MGSVPGMPADLELDDDVELLAPEEEMVPEHDLHRVLVQRGAAHEDGPPPQLVAEDVTYVFDEPTIGLHPHDIQRMNELLRRLGDKGNTVLVAEHKPETI